MLQNAPETTYAQIESATPAAIHGWLLLLCFVLTVGCPAGILYAICWKALPSLSKVQSFTGVFLLAVYVSVFGTVAFFSFWAGWNLWSIKPQAVRFARRFLIGHLIAHLFYFAVWMILVHPTQTLTIARMVSDHIARPIPFTAVWYFYLEHSKRVRETYGES